MKLRFEVDQAACFRRGIDAPTSIVHIEVDPALLTEEARGLIADRMRGIDVTAGDGEMVNGRPKLIKAETPDLAGLMRALGSL